jgi:hypothetical protein
MSAPQFTPGPWSFDGPPASRIVWSGADRRICFLTSDGPNLANARLIAAAPELYEALADIMAHHEGFFVSTFELELATRATAALAKARGEA